MRLQLKEVTPPIHDLEEWEHESASERKTRQHSGMAARGGSLRVHMVLEKK